MVILAIITVNDGDDNGDDDNVPSLSALTCRLSWLYIDTVPPLPACVSTIELWPLVILLIVVLPTPPSVRSHKLVACNIHRTMLYRYILSLYCEVRRCCNDNRLRVMANYAPVDSSC